MSLFAVPAQASPPLSLLAFDGFVLDLNRGVLTAEARPVIAPLKQRPSRQPSAAA